MRVAPPAARLSDDLWPDRLRLLRMPVALLSYVRAPRTPDPSEVIRLQLDQREVRCLCRDQAQTVDLDRALEEELARGVP